MTERQKRFVAEYLKDPNATKAAKAAGYSTKTAYSQGQRLLKNVEISEAVEKRSERALARAEFTVQSHLETLAAIRDAALAEKQYSAATNAEIHRGKVAGFHVQRVEHSGEVTHRMTNEQREERLMDLLAQAKKRRQQELVS